MASMLIKNLPPTVHRKLKAAATEHRRSMAMEALVLIEQGLRPSGPVHWPEPIKTRIPLTQAMLNRAKRWGRS